MDKIAIPEHDVIELNEIAPRVQGLSILIVNVYAVSQASGEWALVDCGLPYSCGRIKRWTEGLFGKRSRPRSILLTHGHFDHTGAVEDLANEWGVPVYVHPRETPYVSGEQHYPPPDPSVGGGLMALLCKLFPRGPVNVGTHLRLLPQDGRIPGLEEWRWIHTPGHTPGHVSFFRQEDRTLLVGDAFATTKQESFLAAAMRTPELHGPPAYFTTDWDAARESVRKLAALHPEAVAPGHGRPLSGYEVAGALDRLAKDFDRVALPEHGLYVHRPAA